MKMSLFIGVLFAPVLLLWAAVLMQTDAQRMQRIEQALMQGAIEDMPEGPAVPEVSEQAEEAPRSVQAADAQAALPVVRQAPDGGALARSAKQYSEDFAGVLSIGNPFQSLPSHKRAEIRGFLHTTNGWADQVYAMLEHKPGAFLGEVNRSQATEATSSIVAARLHYQVEDGHEAEAAASFKALVRLYGGSWSFRDQHHLSQWLPALNVHYQRLRSVHPFSTEELRSLVAALNRAPGWSLREDLIRARRAHAAIFRQWLNLSTAAAIGDYGVISGMKLYLYTTPVFRSVFNRDAELFMDHMDTLVELSEQPWWEVELRLAGISARCKSLPRTSTANVNWLPKHVDAFRYRTVNEAARDLITLGLLTEIYASTHQRFPDRIESLEPLTDIPLPLDPFTGKPYSYRLHREGYTFTSTGPTHPELQPIQLSWEVVEAPFGDAALRAAQRVTPDAESVGELHAPTPAI